MNALPSAPATNDTPDHFGGDVAPFDRVEHMARHLCEEAGGQWDRKGTRKAMWRERAVSALEASDGIGQPSGATILLAASGWLVGGVSWLAWLVLS